MVWAGEWGCWENEIVPSSVTYGDSFSAGEKPFELAVKAISLVVICREAKRNPYTGGDTERIFYMGKSKNESENAVFESMLAKEYDDEQIRLFGSNAKSKSEPIPGSAAWIVENDKRARLKKDEKLIEDLSEEYPALGRIYKCVKGGG